MMTASQVLQMLTSTHLKTSSCCLRVSDHRQDGLNVRTRFAHGDSLSSLFTQAYGSITVHIGPITIPKGKGHVDIRGTRFTSANQAMRKTFGLYANVRPVRRACHVVAVCTVVRKKECRVCSDLRMCNGVTGRRQGPSEKFFFEQVLPNVSQFQTVSPIFTATGEELQATMADSI